MGKRIWKLILLIVILLLWLSIYETTHNLSSNESMVGTTLETNRSEYKITDRESHIWYLETFNFEGQKIRYLDRWDRDGTPILLVHGTPTNSWLRRKMVPGLVAQWYRVIAPDMFGFWTSDKINNHEELTPARQSQRIIGLMDDLDIQEFAIAGHDQGSLRVWETITSIPDRISHLVILNSIWVREWFHPPAWFGSANLVTKFSGRAMGSKFLGRFFAYGAMSGGLKDIKLATMTMINGYLFPLFKGTNECYYDFITHFDEIENQLPVRHAEFIKLDIPTTIIRWKHDKILVGEEQIPTLQELFKVSDENTHLLESGAHFIQEEIPGEINKIIGDFVK